jgi:hypothetical protein
LQRSQDPKYAGYFPEKWHDGGQTLLESVDEFLAVAQKTCDGEAPLAEDFKTTYQSTLSQVVLQDSRLRRLLDEAPRPWPPLGCPAVKISLRTAQLVVCDVSRGNRDCTGRPDISDSLAHFSTLAPRPRQADEELAPQKEDEGQVAGGGDTQTSA